MSGLVHREAGPADGPPVLLVHGYPESSHMWRHVLEGLGAAGWRAIAPDLPGFGDSPVMRPGTWTRHVEALEAFRQRLDLGRVALVVHDWGGLIGLRWACDNPGAVSALVISNTGFFPDAKWHGLAQSLRKEGTGESLIEGLTRDAFVSLMESTMPEPLDDEAIDQYWKAYGDEERRAAQLELYRSGEFSELEAYEGRLAALGVPTLVLWGSEDAFAPVAGAHRFVREIPGAELSVLEGGGHFLFDERPEETTRAVVGFLEHLLPAQPGASARV
jgi:haloalkane dehalogenase